MTQPLSSFAALSAPSQTRPFVHPSIGFTAKDNYTYRRTAVDVRGWRQVEQVGNHSGLDDPHRVALVRAMRLLDQALVRPLHVMGDGNTRVVEVFGAIQYKADAETRQFSAGCFDQTGAFAPLDYHQFSVFPALLGTWWLGVVLDVWGLPWRSTGSVPAARNDDQDRLLLKVLRRMLDRDVRFRRLRLAIGPSLLGESLFVVALRMKSGMLTDDEANRIWRHGDACFEVARVHPKLLPLLNLWLRRNPKDVNAGNVVARLRQALLGETPKLPASAWRWVVRHGVRPFVTVGVSFSRVRAMVAAVNSVEPRQPLPPRFLQAWLNVNEPVDEPKGCGCALDPKVRRIIFKEATRRRNDPDFGAWCVHAERIMYAATIPGNKIEAIPSRVGWRWLEKTALKAEQDHRKRLQVAGLQWDSAIGQHCYGEYKVVPLESGNELFNEGLAMSSCIAEYAEQCAEGDHRIFSVRDKHGKPLGDILLTIRLEETSPLWRVEDAKRRFNRPANRLLTQIAESVACLYNAADSVQASPIKICSRREHHE